MIPLNPGLVFGAGDDDASRLASVAGRVLFGLRQQFVEVLSREQHSFAVLLDHGTEFLNRNEQPAAVGTHGRVALRDGYARRHQQQEADRESLPRRSSLQLI